MSRAYPGKVTSWPSGEGGRPMVLVRLLPPAIGFVLVPSPGELPKGARVWVRPTGDCPISGPWSLTPQLVHRQAETL